MNENEEGVNESDLEYLDSVLHSKIEVDLSGDPLPTLDAWDPVQQGYTLTLEHRNADGSIEIVRVIEMDGYKNE